MSECYYSQCGYHMREEPLCTIDECKATPEQLVKYSEERQKRIQEFLDECMVRS